VFDRNRLRSLSRVPPPCTGRIWTLLAALALALWIGGCATTPTPRAVEDPELAWQARQALLSAQRDWRFRGRIAIRHGEQGWQAGLNWRQRHRRFDIEVQDPLGRKVAQLDGDAGSVTLTTSDGETARAADPERLMQRVLGWSLPVSGLRYWVLGVPDPEGSRPRLELDEAGRLSRLTQDGWAVEYRRYEPGTRVDLPSKLVLSRADLRVRLIVKDWQLQIPL
jgi:outer membrane lipoprotein LolB